MTPLIGSGNSVGSLIANGLKWIQCLKRFQRKGETDLKNNREDPAETERLGIIPLSVLKKGSGELEAAQERPILSIGMEGSM